MLLNFLTRKEKLKFLDLALHVVSVDGSPSEVEQRLLNILLAEVGDGIVKEYQFALSKNMDETLKFFIKSTEPVRNIVYLNLLHLTMWDDLYNTLEHFLLETIREKFEITETKKKQLMQLVYSDRDLRERAKRVVFH